MAASKFDVLYDFSKSYPLAAAYRVFEILILPQGKIITVHIECLFAFSRESNLWNQIVKFDGSEIDDSVRFELNRLSPLA